MLRALVALFLLSIVACGQNEKTYDQGTTFLLPWSDSDAELTLQHVHISTLRNPSIAEGPAARVFIGAGVNGQNFVGAPAKPRWIKSGSLFTPSDTKSGQAVTVYANFERIWQMDQKLGIANQLRWPRQISLGVPGFEDETDNAFYVAELDVSVVLPFSMDGSPMSLDRAILGHEHFHAHFEKAFNVPRESYYKKKGRTPSDSLILARGSPFEKVSSEWGPNEHNAFLMDALNEGLADFFAYVYSSNTFVMSRSLSSIKEKRQIDKGSAAILTSTQWEELMTKPEIYGNHPDCDRHCRKYALGTRYARMLYQLTVQTRMQSGVDAKSAREEIAVMIMKALPLAGEKFAEAEMNGRKVEPQQLFDWLVQK